MEFTSEQKRRRLAMLVVVMAAYVLSFFQRFAPAGIAQDLAAAFQTTAASLGALAATYFYVYTVMQVPTGILVDTLGARRILLLGGLVGGVGSLMFGMAETLNTALVGRTLVGLGVSVVFIAALKIIAVWYEERRFATVVGVFMLVGNLGSVLAGAPLSWLAQTAGWRGVFTGVGIVSLALGAACWLLVRDPAGNGAWVADVFLGDFIPLDLKQACVETCANGMQQENLTGQADECGCRTRPRNGPIRGFHRRR